MRRMNRLLTTGAALSAATILAACTSSPEKATPAASASAERIRLIHCIPVDQSELQPIVGQTAASMQAADFASRLFKAMNARCGIGGPQEQLTVSTMGEVTRLQLVRDLGKAGTYTLGADVMPGEDGIVQPGEIRSWDALQEPANDDTQGVRIKINAGRFFDDPSGTDWYYRQGEQGGPANPSLKPVGGAAHTQENKHSAEAFATSDGLAWQMFELATHTA